MILRTIVHREKRRDYLTSQRTNTIVSAIYPADSRSREYAVLVGGDGESGPVLAVLEEAVPSTTFSTSLEPDSDALEARLQRDVFDCLVLVAGDEFFESVKRLRPAFPTLPLICVAESAPIHVASLVAADPAIDYVPTTALFTLPDRIESAVERAADNGAIADGEQTILDGIEDIFYIYSPENRLVKWNGALRTVSGYTDEELAAIDIVELVAPEERDRVRQHLQALPATEPVVIEMDVYMKGGDRLPYEFRSIPLSGPDGAPIGRCGIGRDISEQVVRERALEESETRYRTLVEGSPDPIVVTTDDTLVFANEAFLSMVSQDRETVLGARIFDFLPQDDHDEATELIEQLLTGGDVEMPLQREVLINGQQRIVEAISKPIVFDGERALLAHIKDITDQARYERALTELHRTATQFITCTTAPAVYNVAIGAAKDIIGLPVSTFYHLDETGDTLVDATPTLDGERNAEPRGSNLWNIFVSGEPAYIEDADPDDSPIDKPLRSCLAIPIGVHSVFVAGSQTEPKLSTSAKELANLLSVYVENALERADTERAIRDRDRRLAEQTEALAHLNQINDTIRRINRSLLQARSREEILHAVCEQLQASSKYAFAWVGEPVNGGFTQVVQAGISSQYAAQLEAAAGPDAPLFALGQDALDTNVVQVVQNVLAVPEWRSLRKDALSGSYNAVAAVPIGRHMAESILFLHAEEAFTFGEREQEIIGELGQLIGYALESIVRKSSTLTESALELELESDDESSLLNQLSAGFGCTVTLEGYVPEDTETAIAYIGVQDGGERSEAEFLAVSETIESVRLLVAETTSAIYEAVITELNILPVIARFGASLESHESTDGNSTLVIRLPATAPVRAFVHALKDVYPRIRLVARREVSRPAKSVTEIRGRFLEGLTPRQAEAVKIAYYGGFFEWPRHSSAEELADHLDISSPTYLYHLRAAERKLFELVFEATLGD
ncbi:bacterio-opsin activator domain-containing protein [Haladaptatus sp. GCM10026878]|uniref:PAS domain S-box protein n=1 Tax=Haladaptatus sp. GCM10026878 TaxID=3252660 RepID=UPI00361C434C